MTTHRRAWSARAGVVVALVAAPWSLFPRPRIRPTTPTVSDHSVCRTARLRRAERRPEVPGHEQQRRARARTTRHLPTSPSRSPVPRDRPAGSADRDPARSRAASPTDVHRRQLTAGQVAAGQSKAGARSPSTAETGNDDNDAQRGITVRAAAAPPAQPTVREISGKVIDERTGDPVPGAYVADAGRQGPAVRHLRERLGELQVHRLGGEADRARPDPDRRPEGRHQHHPDDPGRRRPAPGQRTADAPADRRPDGVPDAGDANR